MFKLTHANYALCLVIVLSLAVNVALVALYPGSLSRIPSATSPQGTWTVNTLVAPVNWDATGHEARLAKGWSYLGFQYQIITDADENPSVDYEGYYHVYTWSIHNIWTNAGMNRTQHKLGNPNLVSGNNNEFAQYISVHTSLADGTCAYTSTTLANEQSTNGLSRAAGSFVAGTASAGDVRWNQTKSFSVTGTTNGINATGLWTASSGGTLFACGQFAPTNVANGDTLQIRHSSNMTNVRFAYWGLIVTSTLLAGGVSFYSLAVTSKRLRRRGHG